MITWPGALYSESPLIIRSEGSIIFFTIITATVDKFDEIADSLCVGQKINDGGDERVVLFLKIAQGHTFTDMLVGKVKGAIRRELSARHVPAVILETEDIPVSHSLVVRTCVIYSIPSLLKGR